MLGAVGLPPDATPLGVGLLPDNAPLGFALLPEVSPLDVRLLPEDTPLDVGLLPEDIPLGAGLLLAIDVLLVIGLAEGTAWVASDCCRLTTCHWVLGCHQMSRHCQD